MAMKKIEKTQKLSSNKVYSNVYYIYIKFTLYFCYYLYQSNNENAGKWMDVTKNKLTVFIQPDYWTGQNSALPD